MRIPRPSPSRQGKMQVIAFLLPTQIQAAYAKATREEKTNQEIIAEALNAVFAEHGLPMPVPVEHRRIVRRGKGTARIRNEDTNPACRAGRQSYGGWFDQAIVAKLNKLSSELNISIQGVIERGVLLVTGVGAVEESWEAAWDRSQAVRKEPPDVPAALQEGQQAVA